MLKAGGGSCKGSAPSFLAYHYAFVHRYHGLDRFPDPKDTLTDKEGPEARSNHHDPENTGCGNLLTAEGIQLNQAGE